MWSYSAPDRTPQPSAAPPHDGHEQVARRHQHPNGKASKLRLVTHSNTDSSSFQKEETS
jgi:hypothetical protein